MSLLFSQSDADDLRKRELPRATVKPSLHDLQGAVLFGAGFIGHQILMHMHRLKIRPAWIIDNNRDLWDTKIQGIPVRSPESLHEVGERIVLISSSYLRPMGIACSAARVRKWSWFTDVSEIFGHLSITITAEELLIEPEIDRLFGLLEKTDESRLVLKKVLTFRVTGDRDDLPFSVLPQYFPANLIPRNYYTSFVDCGAYNGDTLQEWIFNKQSDPFAPKKLQYFGFEPDPFNFKLLQNNHSNLSERFKNCCHLYPFAVGAESERIRMVQNGAGTVLCDTLESGPEAKVVRLDEVLGNEKVGVIKMDIEGFELLALEGARGILEKQRPALLICVYHRPEHLWKIPLWIHDLGLGYKLFLRHHSTSFAETVCYAVPTNKTKF